MVCTHGRTYFYSGVRHPHHSILLGENYRPHKCRIPMFTRPTARLRQKYLHSHSSMYIFYVLGPRRAKRANAKRANVSNAVWVTQTGCHRIITRGSSRRWRLPCSMVFAVFVEPRGGKEGHSLLSHWPAQAPRMWGLCTPRAGTRASEEWGVARLGWRACSSLFAR